MDAHTYLKQKENKTLRHNLFEIHVDLMKKHAESCRNIFTNSENLAKYKTSFDNLNLAESLNQYLTCKENGIAERKRITRDYLQTNREAFGISENRHFHYWPSNVRQITQSRSNKNTSESINLIKWCTSTSIVSSANKTQAEWITLMVVNPILKSQLIFEISAC